eukprot:759071-Hanusia_phi.AAC.1
MFNVHYVWWCLTTNQGARCSDNLDVEGQCWQGTSKEDGRVGARGAVRADRRKKDQEQRQENSRGHWPSAAACHTTCVTYQQAMAALQPLLQRFCLAP